MTAARVPLQVFRINVAASYRTTIGELLTQRRRYRPGSAYRKRVGNQIRRLAAKCRRLS